MAAQAIPAMVGNKVTEPPNKSSWWQETDAPTHLTTSRNSKATPKPQNAHTARFINALQMTTIDKIESAAIEALATTANELIVARARGSKLFP
ncbi:MAG TPA: hypothetical protein VJ420_07000 [Candidatus Udaeobacter sp.]|nr:hypothetical protein [Candidatus Udaeobacter sp.]